MANGDRASPQHRQSQEVLIEGRWGTSMGRQSLSRPSRNEGKYTLFALIGHTTKHTNIEGPSPCLATVARMPNLKREAYWSCSARPFRSFRAVLSALFFPRQRLADNEEQLLRGMSR